ncbi:MAG: hypothetical protein FWG90_11920 [Oscillospiraceae bacterium]|nr:hypothetical protein [Oscillospiraceae bacterium]
MVVIKSEEYVQKFIGVTSSFEGDKLVSEYALQAILNNEGNNTEDAYFLNAKSGELIEHYKLGELGGSIFELPKLDNDEKIIAIHNHPNNVSFSFKDFVTMNNFSEIKTMIAAAHNGAVYFMSVGNGRRLSLYEDNQKLYYENLWGRFYRDIGGDDGALREFAGGLGWIFYVK